MGANSNWLALVLGAVLATTVPLPAIAQRAPAEASIAPLRTVMLMELEGEVAIDAAGKVTDVTIATPVNDALRAGVMRVVRDWAFDPVFIDGVAVPARSKASFLLGALPATKIDRVWVDGVSFKRGDARIEQPNVRITVAEVPKPIYPRGTAYVAARVMATMRLLPDGRVAEVAVVQSALRDVVGRKKDIEATLRAFERVALGAARKFRFDVVVREGARPTADELTVSVPFQFATTPEQQMGKGEWRLHVRSPHQDAPWLSDEGKRLALDGAGLGEGAAPIGGNLRLRTPVGEGAAL
jgi:hypothetical protein